MPDYVRVFRLTGTARGESRADSGDGDADAGGADDDAPIILAGGHSPGRRLAEVGVVAALRRVAAEVLVFMAQLLQKLDDVAFQRVAAVIRTQSDFHGDRSPFQIKSSHSERNGAGMDLL
mgnify:CR=1 FL=1